MATYHINRNRETLGQFDEQDIADGLKSGKFLPTDLAWKDPMPAWLPLAQITDLPAPAPISPTPTGISWGGSSEQNPTDTSTPSQEHPDRDLTTSSFSQFQTPLTPGQIDIGRCLETGWNHFIVNWVNLVLGTLVFLALSIAAQLPFRLFSNAIQLTWTQSLRNIHVNSGDLFVVALFLVGVFIYMLTVAVTYVLKGAYFNFLLNSLRNLTDVKTIFTVFKDGSWIQLAIAGLASALAVLLGFCLLILPGIYIVVGLIYTPFLIVDRKMGWLDAMKLSVTTVHQQWFQVCGLSILLFLSALVGFLLCCVGLAAALPIGYLWLAESYRQLFGESR